MALKNPILRPPLGPPGPPEEPLAMTPPPRTSSHPATVELFDRLAPMISVMVSPRFQSRQDKEDSASLVMANLLRQFYAGSSIFRWEKDQYEKYRWEIHKLLLEDIVRKRSIDIYRKRSRRVQALPEGNILDYSVEDAPAPTPEREDLIKGEGYIALLASIRAMEAHDQHTLQTWHPVVEPEGDCCHKDWVFNASEDHAPKEGPDPDLASRWADPATQKPKTRSYSSLRKALQSAVIRRLGRAPFSKNNPYV